jgi:prepilin peptidase CpaA
MGVPPPPGPGDSPVVLGCGVGECLPTVARRARSGQPTPTYVGINSWGPMRSSELQPAVWGIFAVLVVAAALADVRWRRIPNLLNGALLAVGLLIAAVAPVRASGLLAAALGAGAGLIIWLPFYATGFLGAGDVKFFAALGSWLGPSLAWRASLATAVVGGGLAVVFLVRDGRLGRVAHRLLLSPFVRSTELPRVEELSPEEAKRQLPYGVPMAIGATLALVYPELVGG